MGAFSAYKIERPARPVTIRTREGPTHLEPGDCLSRAEFERRYAAHPEIKKAELVEGVVYMPSPVSIQHGCLHLGMAAWLGVYQAATPRVMAADNVTVRLDLDNEVQPDALLRFEPGHSRATEDGYVEGPPELIVEVAASSVSYDLHLKRKVYQRSGVQEYLAVQIQEERVDWFALHEGVYETLTPDEAGVLRSEVFPGLWLQPAAFWAGDFATMLAVLQEGLASPEHAAFVAQLQSPTHQIPNPQPPTPSPNLPMYQDPMYQER